MTSTRKFLALLAFALALVMPSLASAQQIIRYENTNFPSNDLRNMDARSMTLF